MTNYVETMKNVRKDSGGNELLLNIEWYRANLQNFADPDNLEGELYKTYFASLFNGATGAQYSRWINKNASEIRESNGGRHLGQSKRIAMNKYFNECKVDISWLFSYGNEEEFFKHIDLSNYEVENDKYKKV